MSGGFGLRQRTIKCPECGKSETGLFYGREKWPHADCLLKAQLKKKSSDGSRREKRMAAAKQERIGLNYQIFKMFTEGFTPPPPVTGHLKGGIDQKRMKQVAAEIEAREAKRGNGANIRT